VKVHALRGALVLVSCWLLACMVLLFWQTKLLFIQQPLSAERAALLRSRPSVVGLSVKAPSGVVQLWLHEVLGSAPCLLYFGGNSEEGSLFLDKQAQVGARTVATMNYPGYGLSTGSPSEQSFQAASVAAFDALVGTGKCPRIDLFGRSLGTGVATYVAARRPARRVVLVSPYDSIGAVASDRYWWAPVDVLLRHRFDAKSLAPHIFASVLMVVAPGDRTVRIERSDALFRAWGGPKRFFRSEGADHANLLDLNDAWGRIRAFLDAP
jgi:pimeloyl-ACP methyl ester carboxylesterase